MSRPLALLLALAAAPAHAEPLTFGDLNGTNDLAASTDLTACRPTTDGLQRCQLARRTFGGLDIVSSEAMLNRAGRLRSLRIELDRTDHDTATQLLTGRYGAPQAESWTRFDDGARIDMARTGRASVITFDFPANTAAASPATPRIDWLMPVLIALGLIFGWLLYRWQWRRPRVSEPARTSEPRAPLSMRDTLERKLREGHELRF